MKQITKQGQIDCEWCGKEDCEGYSFICNMHCFHYACNKCFNKLERKFKEEQ